MFDALNLWDKGPKNTQKFWYKTDELGKIISLKQGATLLCLMANDAGRQAAQESLDMAASR